MRFHPAERSGEVGRSIDPHADPAFSRQVEVGNGLALLGDDESWPIALRPPLRVLEELLLLGSTEMTMPCLSTATCVEVVVRIPIRVWAPSVLLPRSPAEAELVLQLELTTRKQSACNSVSLLTLLEATAGGCRGSPAVIGSSSADSSPRPASGCRVRTITRLRPPRRTACARHPTGPPTDPRSPRAILLGDIAGPGAPPWPTASASAADQPRVRSFSTGASASYFVRADVHS